MLVHVLWRYLDLTRKEKKEARNYHSFDLTRSD